MLLRLLSAGVAAPPTRAPVILMSSTIVSSPLDSPALPTAVCWNSFPSVNYLTPTDWSVN
jgi:hypothetical protein